MINLYKSNAQEAFEYLYDYISDRGEWFDGTRAVFNASIELAHPEQNLIKTDWRNWSEKYAHNEWLWYKSHDPSIERLGEINGSIPPIWKRMADSEGNVNSNYGYQWSRNDQLDYVTALLRENPNTRKAAISIYDAKEWNKYKKDTPCTYSIQFTIREDRLYMSVYMRSNDLWFGFCNDQYCFSQLQLHVARSLDLEVGTYFHHAHNLHIYDNQLGRGPENPKLKI